MTKHNRSPMTNVRNEQLARVEIVKGLLKTKERWTPYELSKLTNYILAPELQNHRWDKTLVDDYPILSNRQIKRRQDNCVTYIEE